MKDNAEPAEREKMTNQPSHPRTEKRQRQMEATSNQQVDHMEEVGVEIGF